MKELCEEDGRDGITWELQERNWGGGLWVFVNCLSDWIDCHDGGGGGKGVWAGGGKEVC